MRSLTYLILGLSCSLPLTLADRSTNAHNTPTICNNEPDATGTAIAQRRIRRSQDRAVSVDTFSPSFPEKDLLKRSGVVSYDDNCNNAPPTGSGYGPPDFPTMKSVLQQAYTDAVTLAGEGASIDVNSPAFTHYFGGTASDAQATHFKAMMAAVTSNTQYFSIQFECSGTVSGCASGDSAAFTDATAGDPNTQKIINICPRFWTAATTGYFLYDQSKGSNPAKPYRDNSDGQNGWCGKTQGASRRNCQFFATAGHTILHELTHLDSLAAQAGLAAPDTGNDQGRHGTDDAQTGCELLGARAWLQTYKQDDQQTSPDYNAESYAAAATEAYFMNLCGFSEIRPLVAASSASSSSSAVATPTQTPSPASSVAPPPAYATGTCSFHLQEWQDCEGDSKNLFAIVNMKDNNHNDIGDTNTSPDKNPLGDPINASNPLSFTSKLPIPLVIVGEHQNDYVQFSYGNLQWTSRTTSGPATCSNGGWDPKDGPVCSSRFGNTLAKNQMDCSFPC